MSTAPRPSIIVEPIRVPERSVVSLRSEKSIEGQRFHLGLHLPEPDSESVAVRLTVPPGGRLIAQGPPLVLRSALYLELKPKAHSRLVVGLPSGPIEIRHRIRVGTMGFARDMLVPEGTPRRISAIESGLLTFSSLGQRRHDLGSHTLLAIDLPAKTEPTGVPGELLSIGLDEGLLSVRAIGRAQRIALGKRDLRPRVLAVWRASSEWSLFLAVATAIFSFLMSYHWFRQ